MKSWLCNHDDLIFLLSRLEFGAYKAGVETPCNLKFLMVGSYLVPTTPNHIIYRDGICIDRILLQQESYSSAIIIPHWSVVSLGNTLVL